MSFVHLHVHSQYSLLEASCRIEDMIAKCQKWSMPAVALTDVGNMFGGAEFYFSCKQAGIKPLIGLEVLIAPSSRFDKGQSPDQITLSNRKLVLLAMNYEGYQALCRISTIGYQEGFYYRPRIDYEVLEKYSEHLIALSGGVNGEVPWTFLNQGADAAKQKAQTFKNIYGDRFYLEMNRTGVPKWDKINPFLLELSEDLQVPLVAANDVHYTEQDDQLSQEVLVCIGSNKVITDESRYRLGSDQFYFKSPDEMRKLFDDIPQVCDRTLEIAERCDVEFKLKNKQGHTNYHLPAFPTSKGVSLLEEMRQKSYEGFKNRVKFLKNHGREFTKEQITKYNERLDYELSIIDKMGFNGYFLIVQDFINWAKENSIPVGPGRGSGAGSLVAYSLGITDLDPIEHNLIFERFLNPERISMPDFDIDFCQDRRGEVIDYVSQRYGASNVAQIITYGKLKAKAAVRDVGRVLGMVYSEVDTIAKLIPDDLNMTLTKALEQEPRLTEMREMDPQLNNLLDIALKVEGLVRHAGIHAAGVIIADKELVNYSPLSKGSDGESVVQFDMKYAEKIGLIKFDFLGLKTLTHIQYALELVEKNYKKKISPEQIDVNDKGIYEILSSGDTAGIFQFAGDGITDATRMIKPKSFSDITAITSLYRPGPMEMIGSYADRYHGREEVKYVFPELENILKETYGIIVYQEQVQLIAAKIAGYSLGEADMLRRAMGKKITEEMQQHRTRFIEGAVEKKFDKVKAGELFELMAKFASYGFNKSHAAAYCVVTAQTAWLKKYYPVEFYAGLLSCEMNSTDKVVRYIKDARTHNIEVVSPHINKSSVLFEGKDNTIFYSMGAVKGVGTAAVEAIVEAREKLEKARGGEGRSGSKKSRAGSNEGSGARSQSVQFASLEEFFETVDLRRVNKKVMESLIKAGAFDGFGYNRATLFQDYSKFLDRAERNRQDKEVGQESFFDMIDAGATGAANGAGNGAGTSKGVSNESQGILKEIPEWSRQLRLQHEKEVLGFYLSDHPLSGLENFLNPWVTCSVSEIVDKYDQIPRMKGMTPYGRTYVRRPVVFSGILSGQKSFITKKGDPMAFAQLEDFSGAVELVIPPAAYSKVRHLVDTDQPVLISGELEKKENVFKVIVENIQIVEEKIRSSKRVTFNFSKDFVDKQFKQIKTVCDECPGETQVLISVFLDDLNRKTILKTPDGFRVKADFEFIERLRKDFGNLDFIELN